MIKLREPIFRTYLLDLYQFPAWYELLFRSKSLILLHYILLPIIDITIFYGQCFFFGQ